MEADWSFVLSAVPSAASNKRSSVLRLVSGRENVAWIVIVVVVVDWSVSASWMEEEW